jgi:Capsule assembly protein Wzi
LVQAFASNALGANSPATNDTSTTNRMRLLRGGVVASFGNQALAFGYQEMAWGTGYFGALAQGDNARTFPAVTFENVHPSLLPGFLLYQVGPFRHQIFVGQLDHSRYAE